MKVLLLNGSPRVGGNTDTALNAIQEGFLQNTDAQVEMINLRECEIVGCKGCNYCKTTNGTCATKDDGQVVADKVVEADVVIFGSPVYWWGISSQLKTAIDRVYMKGALLVQKPKKIGVLAVGSATLDDPEYEIIGKQFKCISEYLRWDLIAEKYISATEKSDLAKDSEKVSQLKELYKKFV